MWMIMITFVYKLKCLLWNFLGISPQKYLILTAGPVTTKKVFICPWKCCPKHKRKWEAFMALVLTEEEQVVLKITPKTKKGNVAKVDGLPVWSSSSPDVLVVQPLPDDVTGFTAVAKAVGPVGVAQVQVKVDADLGEGVRELTALLDVQVVAAEAVSLEVVPGVPEVQK